MDQSCVISVALLVALSASCSWACVSNRGVTWDVHGNRGRGMGGTGRSVGPETGEKNGTVHDIPDVISVRREDFNFADNDKDGDLTKKEWKMLFVHLLHLYDINGDNVISRSELNLDEPTTDLPITTGQVTTKVSTSNPATTIHEDSSLSSSESWSSDGL